MWSNRSGTVCRWQVERPLTLSHRIEKGPRRPLLFVLSPLTLPKMTG